MLEIFSCLLIISSGIITYFYLNLSAVQSNIQSFKLTSYINVLLQNKKGNLEIKNK